MASGLVRWGGGIMATNVRRLYWLWLAHSKIVKWNNVADLICDTVEVVVNFIASIIKWVLLVPLFIILSPLILVLHGTGWLIRCLIGRSIKGLTKKQELKLGDAVRRVYRNKGK